MKKLLMMILALSFTFLTTHISYGAQYWAKTYGGSREDRSHSIQQTLDGGFIVAGKTLSFGAGVDDFWVLKLDNYGNASWQKTYGGIWADWALSIQQQTTDGGYILAGYTSSFGAGWADIWVLKLDSNGNISWQKTYGESDTDWTNCIRQTTDGGYIVAGHTKNFGVDDFDIWVLKLDSDGNISWQKTYGGINDDWAYSIQQTLDGGFIVAGVTNSFGAGYDDFWVFKLDSDGNISWQKTYGGINDDWAYSIQQTLDGGYIIAGVTTLSSVGGDIWVLKLDSNGNISWQKTYGGGSFDEANSIQQTSDGGYIVAGRTLSFGAGIDDCWVLKLDSIGDISWQKTYGKNLGDWAYSVQETFDAGYIVSGLMDLAKHSSGDFGVGNFFVLKADGNGNIPDCDIIGISNATVHNTSAFSQSSSATINSTSAIVSDTDITPQDTLADITTICSWIDSDGDGISDDEDNCPESNLDASIVVDSCNSGVGNHLFEDGCTMSDLIAECAKGAKNHGKFVSCVSQLTNNWKKQNLISGKDKGAIQSCAAKANIP